MTSVSADGAGPSLLVCVHHLSPAATAILRSGRKREQFFCAHEGKHFRRRVHKKSGRAQNSDSRTKWRNGNTKLENQTGQADQRGPGQRDPGKRRVPPSSASVVRPKRTSTTANVSRNLHECKRQQNLNFCGLVGGKQLGNSDSESRRDFFHEEQSWNAHSGFNLRDCRVAHSEPFTERSLSQFNLNTP